MSRVDQKILEVFFREGYFERHLNRMRGVYRAKHDCLLNEMKKLQDICQIKGENAGVHILVEMKNGMTEKEAVETAKSVGIKVYGLSEYCTEPLEKRRVPTILMGYATLSEKHIQEAVSRLEKVWTEQK